MLLHVAIEGGFLRPARGEEGLADELLDVVGGTGQTAAFVAISASFSTLAISAFSGWFNISSQTIYHFHHKILTFFGTYNFLSRKVFEKSLHTYIIVVSCYFIVC